VKRNPFGVETKTAASTGIGGLVTLVLLLNSWQRWFAPPPPDVTAAIVATVSGLVAYWAPHTPRMKPLTAEELAVVDRALARPQPGAAAPGLPPGWPDTKSYTQPATPTPAPEGTTP
jgi:hypothetical protein